MLLAREMFNPDAALFELSPSGDGSYQPFGNSGINELHLSYFKFCGRMIGKAVYDGYLVDAHFTRPFYKHMLGVPLNYEDMEAFDQDYYKNLTYMLEHPLAESGLDHLTFSETSMYFGLETNVELIPGGHDVPVTDDNKLEYVNLVTAHKMTNAIKDQIAAFTRGFNDIVPHDVIKISNNYNHLFEQPTLFYAVAIAIAVAGIADSFFVACAWGFVLLRVAHSLVQATVDVVMVRFGLFLLSWVVLAAMSIRGISILA